MLSKQQIGVVLVFGIGASSRSVVIRLECHAVWMEHQNQFQNVAFVNPRRQSRGNEEPHITMILKSSKEAAEATFCHVRYDEFYIDLSETRSVSWKRILELIASMKPSS